MRFSLKTLLACVTLVCLAMGLLLGALELLTTPLLAIAAWFGAGAAMGAAGGLPFNKVGPAVAWTLLVRILLTIAVFRGTAW